MPKTSPSSTSAKSKTVGSKAKSSDGKAKPSAAKANATALKPASIAAKANATAIKPASIAAKAKPTAVRAASSAAKANATAAKAKPTAPKPASAAAKPASAAAKPKPTSVKFKPSPVPGLSEGRDSRGILWQVLESPAHRALNVALRVRVPASVTWTPSMRLIPAMVGHGCAAVPGMAAFARKLDSLYGARIGAATTRDGRIQQMVWILRMALPETLPDGAAVYREALEMLRGAVMEPALYKGGYLPDLFAAEREQLQMQVAAEIDDKASYGMQRAMTLSHPSGSPYGLLPSGTLDAIGSVTPVQAWRRCQDILARGDLTISIFGPVDKALHIKPVQEVFAGLHREVDTPRLIVNRPARHVETPIRAYERHRTEQAQLAMTFSTGINLVHKDWAPVRFATAILGAMNTSRLFSVVREEYGLAYAVGAFLVGQTGVVVMHAGTEGGKLSAARKLMLRELERLATEGVTDEEFANARQWLADVTLAAQDSLAVRLDGLATTQACGRPMTADESIERLMAVTPDQVRKAAARMRPLAEFSVRPK